MLQGVVAIAVQAEALIIEISTRYEAVLSMEGAMDLVGDVDALQTVSSR